MLFIVVEQINNRDKYNALVGFKYLDGIRSLKKDIELHCKILNPFANEKERKLYFNAALFEGKRQFIKDF